MNLSNHIYRASVKYKIPARIYTAILMQESRYKLNAMRIIKGHSKPDKSHMDAMLQGCTDLHYLDNKYDYVACINRVEEVRIVKAVVTDYGIAQIYYRTADSYKFDTKLLISDLKYSVESGAKVLAFFHKRYSKKESDWWVRYNVGTRPKHRIKMAWNEYKLLVSRYL